MNTSRISAGVTRFRNCAYRPESGAINHSSAGRIPLGMLARNFLLAGWLGLTLVLAGCTACGSKPNPDEVRRQTADATAQLKENAKAVAEGLKDGLTRPTTDHPLDLNAASKSQLKTLPGITDDAADRIIANRPYKNQHELLDKRVISRDEYNRIADAITVKP